MPDPPADRSIRSASALRDANRTLLDELADLENRTPAQSLLDRIECFQAAAVASGAYLAAAEDRAEAQSMISFWMTVLVNHGRDPETVLLESFDTEAARDRAGNTPPYKGLEPFQIEDFGWFFGRHQAVAAMLDMLAVSRFLAVTGLSGSGKSSVVRAGLIPRLRDGAAAGSNEWLILEPVVPGKDPMAALAAIARAIDESTEAIATPAELVAALDRAGRPVLLSIDQFEELFTLNEWGDEQRLFVDALVMAAGEGQHRHVVLITMRSEYDALVEKHPKFAELFRAGRVQIEALSAKELRAAIEQPAAQVGVGFEAGLVDELVQRVLGEPAGLPLLQFTLLELWKQLSRENLLTWDVYKKLGGSPREILAVRADRIYKSFKIKWDRILSKRIFLALIGSGLEPTSRRAVRSELDPLGSRDNLDRVLGIWQQCGLIRISPPGAIKPESQVEVAHEALIRNWGLLGEWIEDAFASNRRRRVLTERALAWRDKKDTLLGELSLQEAEEFDDLSDEEAEYVSASRVAVDRANAWIRRRMRIAWAASLGAVALIVVAFSAFYVAYARGRIAVQQEQALTRQKKTLVAVRVEEDRAQAAAIRSRLDADLQRQEFDTRLVALNRRKAEVEAALAASEAKRLSIIAGTRDEERRLAGKRRERIELEAEIKRATDQFGAQVLNNEALASENDRLKDRNADLLGQLAAMRSKGEN